MNTQIKSAPPVTAPPVIVGLELGEALGEAPAEADGEALGEVEALADGEALGDPPGEAAPPMVGNGKKSKSVPAFRLGNWLMIKPSTKSPS